MGRWRTSDQEGRPYALGYIPKYRLPRLQDATGLSINGLEYWKIADLPIEAYQDVVERCYPELGPRRGPARSVFLPGDFLAGSPDPFEVYSEITSVSSKRNNAIVKFVTSLGLDVPVGVVGSALIQRSTTRPEIDLVFEGDHIESALATGLDALVVSGVAARDMFYATRFIVDGVCIDVQVERSAGSVAVVDAEILQSAVEVSDVTVQICGTVGGWLMPASYLLSDGSTLISFRLGHRGMFGSGDRLHANSLRVHRPVEGETRFLVTNDEWLDRTE